MPLRVALFLLLACAAATAAFTVVGEAAAPAEPYYEVWIAAPGAETFTALAQSGVIVHEVTPTAARAWVSESTLGLLNRQGFEVTPVMPTPEVPAAAKQETLAYPTYAEVTEALHTYHSLYPDITALYSLGQSVEGRELWALLITDNPGIIEDEPAFKYVSTMHGDEPLGTPLMLYLIDRLLTGYMVEPRITELVNETAIWIVPLMNPDGYERTPRRIRRNANNIDLNRAFPTFPNELTGFFFDGAPLRDEGRQPEVIHVMRWSAENYFVLSANIHTGALLVNYPYDDDGKGSVFSPTPDEDVFRHVSLVYASNNPPMFASTSFENGITNGAEWFTIDGGMQDWNYRYLGTKEVTLELSVTKTPPASQLPQFWEDNEESLLAYLEQVHIGVRGLVTDAVTGAPLAARVLVHDREQPVFTNPAVGNYHRLLLPGEYTLTFEAPGYQSAVVPGVIVDDGPATRVDVVLSPIDAVVAVPDLRGLTPDAAALALADAGLTLGTETTVFDDAPQHTVIAQSPAAGQTVNTGSAVAITVSLGQPGGLVARLVDDRTDAPVLGATVELDPPGFALVDRGDGTYSNFMPAGTYILTVTEAASGDPALPFNLPVSVAAVVEAGAIGELEVRLAPPRVPAVVGLTEAAATQAIAAAGLTRGTVAYELDETAPAGTVIAQTPAADLLVPPGTAVAITVARAEVVLPGDVNGDGVIDAVDVQLVINAALGLDIAPLSGDVNGDGTVNAVDVQLVVNAALGIAP